MAKDFDATLSDAIDVAAGAAQTPGAMAARTRGQKRTLHKRVALSAMSVALVAAGSTAALTLSSSHGGAIPVPPAATSDATPTTPASPTLTTGSSPTGTPGSSESSGSSGSSDSPGTTTSHASASGTSTMSATSPASATAPSPSWLTPGQVPFHDLMNWSAATPVHCTGSMIFNANFPGNCMLHSQPGTPHAAQKLDIVLFNSVGALTGNGAWAQPVADQNFFTYANAADAQAAFQSITHELLAEDAQYKGAIDVNTNRPLVSTTTITAQSAGGMAIDHKLRNDKGAPGEMNGENSSASDTHFYLAVKGNVLEVLEVQGGVSISDTSNDKAVLATVVSALS